MSEESQYKHIKVKLPYELGIDFIAQFIKPGESSLSGLFGWSQPNEDDTIIVGDVYSTVSAPHNHYKKPEGYTWAELLEYVENEEERAEIAEEYKELINKRANFDSLFLWENPSMLFSELEEVEKFLYRMSVLWVNMIGESGHEFAIYYMQFLGYQYINLFETECNLYEEQTIEDELVNRIVGAHRDLLLPIFEINHYQNDEEGSEYHYDAINEFRKYQDTGFYSWLKDTFGDDEIGDYFENKLTELGYPGIRWYEIRDEILPVLVYTVEKFIEYLYSGDLKVNPDHFEGELGNWIKQYGFQMDLFEED